VYLLQILDHGKSDNKERILQKVGKKFSRSPMKVGRKNFEGRALSVKERVSMRAGWI
jgi:hypothetical protein